MVMLKAVSLVKNADFPHTIKTYQNKDIVIIKINLLLHLSFDLQSSTVIILNNNE